MTVTAEELQNKFQWTNLSKQYFGTIAVNLIMLANGLSIAWFPPALDILTSQDTPLVTGPLTSGQISWLGSINCVSGLLGSCTIGYVTSLIGCKRATIILSIPVVGFWLLVYFGTTFYLLIVARFLGGFTGGGIQVTVILYVSEIANDENRGALGSFALSSRNIGILFGFLLGAFVEYNIIPFICVSVPIIFVVIFGLLPNTPQFYIRNGHIQKAENALKYYKGYGGNNEQEDKALYAELDRLKLIASKQKEDAKLKISDLCNRAAMKGFGVGVAMSVFSQISGCFIIINYAVLVFKRTGTLLNINLSSILLAVAILLGPLTTSYFADKLGRKKLNFISMMGSSLGLLCMSLYSYLHLCGYDLSTFSVVPIICLSFVCFIASAGIIPLVVVCSIEYLPPNIRTFGMAFDAFVINLVCFASTKIFPIILEMYDLHVCMMIYGIGSLASAVFILFAMTETNGRSLDEDIKERSRISSIISL